MSNQIVKSLSSSPLLYRDTSFQPLHSAHYRNSLYSSYKLIFFVLIGGFGGRNAQMANLVLRCSNSTKGPQRRIYSEITMMPVYENPREQEDFRTNTCPIRFIVYFVQICTGSLNQLMV